MTEQNEKNPSGSELNEHFENLKEVKKEDYEVEQKFPSEENKGSENKEKPGETEQDEEQEEQIDLSAFLDPEKMNNVVLKVIDKFQADACLKFVKNKEIDPEIFALNDDEKGMILGSVATINSKVLNWVMYSPAGNAIVVVLALGYLRFNLIKKLNKQFEKEAKEKAAEALKQRFQDASGLNEMAEAAEKLRKVTEDLKKNGTERNEKFTTTNPRTGREVKVNRAKGSISSTSGAKRGRKPKTTTSA